MVWWDGTFRATHLSLHAIERILPRCRRCDQQINERNVVRHSINTMNGPGGLPLHEHPERDMCDVLVVPAGSDSLVINLAGWLDFPSANASPTALLPERAESISAAVTELLADEEPLQITIEDAEERVTVSTWTTPLTDQRSRLDLPAGYATRAFEFGSLQHLDQRIAEMREECVRVEGLSDGYSDAMGQAYASFRHFLVEKRAADFFARGDFQRQQLAIREWVGWLHDRGTKRNAINTYFRSLRAVVVRIAERDTMTNPFFKITAPKPERNRIVRSLPGNSVAELQNYIRKCDWRNVFERARNLAILTLFTPGGLRRGDVLNLACGDVDIERGVIHVRAGKGRNGGKDRDVMMTDEMRDILAAYLGERRRAGKTTTAFIASVTLDSKIGESTLKVLFKKLEEGTGIHTSSHPLRHSAVVVLGRNRVPPKQIAEQMGWTEVRMLDRYGAVFDDDRAKVMRRVRLDASFDDPPST